MLCGRSDWPEPILCGFVVVLGFAYVLSLNLVGCCCSSFGVFATILIVVLQLIGLVVLPSLPY